MALPIRNQSEIYDSEKNVAKVMVSFLRVKQPLYRIDGLTLHYDNPVLVGIGKKHNKTKAQVALAGAFRKDTLYCPNQRHRRESRRI
jgi:diketogulonate reductase-like aldo/keto reductase